MASALYDDGELRGTSDRFVLKFVKPANQSAAMTPAVPVMPATP